MTKLQWRYLWRAGLACGVFCLLMGAIWPQLFVIIAVMAICVYNIESED